MKTISLTVWERVMLFSIVSMCQGNWEQNQNYLRLLKILRFDKETEAAIGLQRIENPNGTISFRWNEQGKVFEVQFEDADYKLLYQLAAGFNAWPTDERVEALREKMEKQIN